VKTSECSGCGAQGRPRVRRILRVVFLRCGEAQVVCDRCLERAQRRNVAWSYCYLPASVRS